MGRAQKARKSGKDSTRRIGSKATRNGKPVVWAGSDYGFQSEASFKSLENKGQLRIGAGLSRRAGNAFDDAVGKLPDSVKNYIAEKVSNSEEDRKVFEEALSKHPAGKLYLETKGDRGAAELSKSIEALSKGTNVSPLLIEAGMGILETAASGKIGSRTIGPLSKKAAQQALKAVPKTTRTAINKSAVNAGTKLKNVVKDAPSRVQEFARDVRGKGAKPLGTGGSVGAAGAPTTPRQQKLRDADPYTGRRLDNDAADSIQKISTKTAPKGTVTSKGQTRGAGKAERTQQSTATNALEKRRQELKTQGDQNRRRIDSEQKARARGSAGDLEKFKQNTRGQQAVKNVARRLEEGSTDRSYGLRKNRVRDSDLRQRANSEGRTYQPLNKAQKAVVNADRVPVGLNNRDAIGTSRANYSNPRANDKLKLKGPRQANTVDGKKVINSSERLFVRQRVSDREAARLAQVQANVEQSQGKIAARNRIAGKPARQKAAVQRAKTLGNDRLAEASTARRNEPNKSGLKRQGWTTQATRPANTLKGGKKKVAAAKRRAEASVKAREAAQLKIKRTRSKAGIKARQGTSDKTATSKFSKPQSRRAGPEGKRLFTPTNRAGAARRSGSKLDSLRSDRDKNVVTSAGKYSYATKEGMKHDVGFKSIDPSKEYARPGERRAKGEKVAKKSRTKKEIDSANIQNSLGTLLNKVDIGETVTANPIEGIGGRAGRARYYDRMSKGALKASDGDVKSKRLKRDQWKRDADGAVVDWDPNELKAPIKKLATPTPQQLRGRAVGGTSKLRIRAKDVKGTKVSGKSTATKERNPQTNTIKKKTQKAKARSEQLKNRREELEKLKIARRKRNRNN